MKEEALNMSLRKFLKVVGVTSQQEIEKAIRAAVADGRLETAAGVPLAAETSKVLLCGNPAMLKDTTAALVARGMRKHRRRAPGHISVESFW